MLVTPFPLEEMAESTLSEEDRQGIQRNTWVCAPSFVEFLYRWWLENTIWFKVSESDAADTLTTNERAYLAHYSSNPNSQ